ncbi:MAG: hypothetical protein ACRYFX_19390 [Janthinobacterium lividum]
MKASLKIVGSVAVILMQGCSITNTPGFHSGYKKLSSNEQKQIEFIPANNPIPVVDNGTIYAINAESLLNAIQSSDTTLVYIWGPQCHSRVCLPLTSVQAICRKKGYNLFIVSEYYDMGQIPAQGQLKNPLLSINHEVYGTDYCPKYTKLFTSELRRGKRISDDEQNRRYYLFHGRDFVKALYLPI